MVKVLFGYKVRGRAELNAEIRATHSAAAANMERGGGWQNAPSASFCSRTQFSHDQSTPRSCDQYVFHKH